MMKNTETARCYKCFGTVETGEGYVSRNHLGTATVVHVVCPERKAAPKTTAQEETPAAPAPSVEVPARAVELATERQVAYALRLAARNAEGSLDVTADALRRMTRRDISTLIDSLKSEW
jgi:hypothetical protein